METIININFQGRVIPIEEAAYNVLKQYVDGLRSYFANEESADEIINDIENRIAELLSERLKQGVNCIATEDVNVVINSIGRLEEIEAAEGEEYKAHALANEQPDSQAVLKERFYRNADDEVIAGVCSGIAARVGIDPIIVRVLFVLLAGTLFWIYILLWIIVPSRSLRYKTVRRLYRNPDDKFISGVCGGLAAYFHVQSWIPRLIFVLPLAIAILSNGFHAFWWEWPWALGPGIFAGSLGGTLFILYVVLWIALPYASSSTDKMELRGEKIDINTIKAATQARVSSGADASGSSAGKLGRVIGILFKVFFLFIAGVVALSLFGALTALMFAGTVALPFTNFLFDGWQQYTLAWAGLALTLGIPMLAFIVWVVRRLMGVRSRRHYLAYVFAGLWLTGLTCTMIIVGIMAKNFSSRSVVDGTFELQQPTGGTLHVDVSKNLGGVYNSRHNRWLEDWDDEDAPFRYISDDSLWLNTVKVNVEQSPDSFYHVYEARASRGSSVQKARELASHIPFGIAQQDSLITLPRGFTVSRNDKFRNQQVLVTIEVPVGKRLQLSSDINDYEWFDIEVNRRGTHYKHHHRKSYYSERNYIMTPSGLEAVADTGKAVADTVKADTATHRLEI
jgi:phage shock protein PspC (stress-responsive transcriptional regulator)